MPPPPRPRAAACALPWRHRLVWRYYRRPEHPGRLRLLRALKWLLAVDRVRAELLPGVVMELDEADFVQREILFHGIYEPLSVHRFDLLVAAARGVTDIGAHHGQYTLRAAQALASRGGRVLAVEPMPANAAALLRNAALSGLANIDLFTVALADTCGFACLVEPVAGNTGGTRLGGPAPTTGAGPAVHTAVCRFAELAARLPPGALDVVKVDVEGHEGRVLSDLFAHGGARPRHLLVEYRPRDFDYGLGHELPAWLAHHGYRVCTVTGEPYVAGRPLPEDNLWAELRS